VKKAVRTGSYVQCALAPDNKTPYLTTLFISCKIYTFRSVLYADTLYRNCNLEVQNLRTCILPVSKNVNIILSWCKLLYEWTHSCSFSYNADGHQL